ncbi:MerR family transcriptional regulator [Streptomyces sp. NPDC046332]|uniref:MerR family transcriptional regulator n=1 Tax=Streptomyces sp. NPDC046332 TaxID=3155133 RepID=UPI0033F4DB26
MAGEPMQIGEVAARTEMSLRTIRQYEDSGLVVPSASSQGGFPLYTDADVDRLMVIRRMKPLGFTIDETRDLLAATDRLAEPRLSPAERSTLVARVRRYEQAATARAAELRSQLTRVEEFANSLRAKLGEGS